MAGLYDLQSELAIKTLPDDALGRHHEDGHYFKDELLYDIKNALADLDDGGGKVK